MPLLNARLFKEFAESALDFKKGCYGVLSPSSRINKSTGFAETAKQSLGGWYDNSQKMIDDAKRLGPVNCYVYVNPLSSDLLVFGKNGLNTLERRPERDNRAGASDADVLFIDYLFIDIDSVRSRGPGATDEEHATALALRDTILDGENLRDHAYWGSSGNGGWILLRVMGHPNSAEVVATHKAFLDKLASKYGRQGLSPAWVDTNTANPVRPLPVPGSWKHKGADSPDTPHRQVMCHGGILPGDVVAPDGKPRFDPAAWLAAFGPGIVDTKSPGGPKKGGLGGQRTLPLGSPAPRAPAKPVDPGRIDKRVRGLLDKIHSVQGKEGSKACLDAACVVVKNFGLTPDVAIRYMIEWNGSNADPPWSEAELRHKVDEADNLPDVKPRGWMLQRRPARGPAPERGIQRAGGTG